MSEQTNGNGTQTNGEARDNGDVAYQRHTVTAGSRNPTDIAAEAVDLLLQTNQPPVLFSMGDKLAVRLQPANDVKPYEWLEAFDFNDWFAYTSEHIDFVKRNKDGDEYLCSPPGDVMRIVPGAVVKKIPHLDALVRTPYLAPDGTLIADNGYDPTTKLYLVTNGLKLPTIPEIPTDKQVKGAVAILQEWLQDFPFVDEASRALPIAQLLSHTGRSFVGLIPLFIYEASSPGAGKNLLMHTATVIATGKPPRFQQLPTDEEEQRKTITSTLLDGFDPIAWDETHTITSHALALLLTTEEYSARILGVSKMMTVRNKTLQIASGNNVRVLGDLKRRVVVSRLEPEEEHPELRIDFVHDDLKSWVEEHRDALLGAAFILWRNWVAKAKPEGEIVMGSFEKWSRAVGGCLNAAGIPGFLTNTAQWLADGSDEDDWAPHLEDLVRLFGTGDFTVSQVVRYVNGGFIETLPLYTYDAGRLGHAVGNAYRSVRGRWWGDLRLLASEANSARNGAKKWRVVRRDGAQVPATEPGFPGADDDKDTGKDPQSSAEDKEQPPLRLLKRSGRK